MPDLPLPLEYRAEIIRPLLALLMSGESGAVVGVGSSGKSNIVRHLQRADVLAHYLAAESARTCVVQLTCKSYAHSPIADFYLYALDQLDKALEANPATTERVNDLWNEAQANPERLARRNLDRALSRVIRANITHIFCLLDDCDELLMHAPPALFSDLRDVRDNHKYALVYVTVTRREPAFLRRDGKEFEDFFELFDAVGHTFPLPPYTVADGYHMLRRIAARQNPPDALDENHLHHLYELSGGHAGLLRTMFFAARAGLDLTSPEVINHLATHVEVEAECQKILDSLEQDEQADLKLIALRRIHSDGGQRRLMRRGLVQQRPLQPPEIFSPVFEQMLRLQAAPPPPTTQPLKLQIEFMGTGFVRLNGQAVALTLIETSLLRRLYTHPQRTCSAGDLAEAMWAVERDEGRAERAGGKPAARLATYMNHLRAKLGPAARHLQQDDTRYWLVD